MFLLIYNGNLSLMNIRDFLFINKAKTSDRIKILELLGFESETIISQNAIHYQRETDAINLHDFNDYDVPSYELEVTPEHSSIETYIRETESIYTKINNDSDLHNELPTSAFQPLNVTNKIKKIWTDVESRRQWVIPITIIVLTTFLLGTMIGTFRSRSANLREVVENNTLIAAETNTLIGGLENVLEISTDTFYSKYDISNASAYLQSVESSTLEYQNLLIKNDQIIQTELDEIQANLVNIFKFIDDLDDLLRYRILVSEILIYESLLTIDENTEIDQLTASLSEITAVSKRNFEDLSDIKEMNNHRNLVKTAIITAEDLHGRLLAALRNNEYDVVNSISSALLLNKETELNAFKNSLTIFDQNKTLVFEDLKLLN